MEKGLLSIPAPRHSIEVQRANDRIDALEALRGVAAIMVMISHLAAITYNPVLGEKSENWVEAITWELGAPAVDLFIVLSGYVVTLAWMRSEKYGVTSFYKRRLVRLMPMYWASFALAVSLWVVCAGMILPEETSATLRFHASPLSLEAIAANFFPTAVGYGQMVLNAPWWTLHIEIWGMLITPWLVILARNNLSRTMLLSVIGVLALELVVAPLLHYNQSFVLLGGIAAGTFAALTREKWTVYFANSIWPLGSMAFLLIATAVIVRVLGNEIDQVQIADEIPRILGMAGSLLGIMMLAARPQKHRRGKTSNKRISTWLGQISYPLYVIHYPIIVTVATIAISNGQTIREAQNIAILTAPLVLIMSYYSYLWLDMNAIKASRRVPEKTEEKLSYP